MQQMRCSCLLIEGFCRVCDQQQKEWYVPTSLETYHCAGRDIEDKRVHFRWETSPKFSKIQPSYTFHLLPCCLEGRWDSWNFAVMLDYEIKATIQVAEELKGICSHGILWSRTTTLALGQLQALKLFMLMIEQTYLIKHLYICVNIGYVCRCLGRSVKHIRSPGLCCYRWLGIALGSFGRAICTFNC